MEKDALSGVIDSICAPLRVPYFACRGYVSVSTMHEAAMRFSMRADAGQACVILHVGDHDPSGIHMSRDCERRLGEYGAVVDFRRIALNIEQVRAHALPPNPTKRTDKRTPDYLAKYGRECWEVDALDPAALRDLIEFEVAELRDDAVWEKSITNCGAGVVKNMFRLWGQMM